ncbi:MAG TPA: hypothetical protein PKI66_05070 [Methanobacteriaceae archaeon]|nr:hypothetical protein [Euryarchaeota archaeon]HNR26063.1 hypothetical protein [Methanobacteriaceae archaeon]HNS24598.1 hypothetical protein [Methanobacteriaceae archaeon]
MGIGRGGVNVTDLDLIVYLSMFQSGAQITSDLNLEELYQLQLRPIEDTNKRSVDFDGTKFSQMIVAAIMSSPTPKLLG